MGDSTHMQSGLHARFHTSGRCDGAGGAGRRWQDGRYLELNILLIQLKDIRLDAREGHNGRTYDG